MVKINKYGNRDKKESAFPQGGKALSFLPGNMRCLFVSLNNTGIRVYIVQSLAAAFVLASEFEIPGEGKQEHPGCGG